MGYGELKPRRGDHVRKAVLPLVAARWWWWWWWVGGVCDAVYSVTNSVTELRERYHNGDADESANNSILDSRESLFFAEKRCNRSHQPEIFQVMVRRPYRRFSATSSPMSCRNAVIAARGRHCPSSCQLAGGRKGLSFDVETPAQIAPGGLSAYKRTALSMRRV